MTTINKVWNESTQEKRAELCKYLGFTTDWATLEFEEIGKRGGGMLVRSLKLLFEKLEEKKNFKLSTSTREFIKNY